MVETYFPAHCVRWKMALIEPFNVHTWKKEEKRKKVNSVARKYWSDNEFHWEKQNLPTSLEPLLIQLLLFKNYIICEWLFSWKKVTLDWKDTLKTVSFRNLT